MNLTRIRGIGQNGPRYEKKCPACGCMFYTKPSKDKECCDQSCARQLSINRSVAKLAAEMTKP